MLELEGLGGLVSNVHNIVNHCILTSDREAVIVHEKAPSFSQVAGESKFRAQNLTNTIPVMHLLVEPHSERTEKTADENKHRVDLLNWS